MTPHQRRRLAVVLATAVLTVAGCGSTHHTASGPAFVSPASSATTRAGAPAQDDGASVISDDLRAGSRQQTVRAGRLTLNVTYSTSLPTSRWNAATPKPIMVAVSAVDNSRPDQRVYLSRARLSAMAMDGTGLIGDPVTITDSATIGPGYLINFPYTYSQLFTVGALDDGARGVSVTLSFEVLSLVKEDGSRDYTKQTAVSTLQVPLR